MDIGTRIRELRVAGRLSQSDIEKRSGFPRTFLSRLENNHATPSLTTLERLSRALGVPLIRFFYEGDEMPVPAPPVERIWQGEAADEDLYTRKLRGMVHDMDQSNRSLLLGLAQQMAKRRGRRGR